MTIEHTRRDMSGHADYPHTVGTLYDCTACEGNCFCKEINADQISTTEDGSDEEICVHCAIENEKFNAEAQRKYGRRS